MLDEVIAPMSVRAIRAQLERNALAQVAEENGNIGSGESSSTHGFTSMPTSPLNHRRLDYRPPIPPHSHRRCSHDDSSQRAPKPIIAPKPKRLLETMTPILPEIVVETDVPYTPGPPSSVRDLARALEGHVVLTTPVALSETHSSPSFAFDSLNPSTINSRSMRPTSFTSESTASGGEEDDTSTDSDEPSTLPSTSALNVDTPPPAAKLNYRRPSSLGMISDNTIHERIMEDLLQRNVIRKSHHLFTKRRDSPNSRRRIHDPAAPSDSSKTAEEVDENVQVKMRPESIARPDSNTFSSSSGQSFDTTTHDSSSGASRRLSLKGYTVSDYNTGDEADDERLKKLHHAAIEILTVQRKFVLYLNIMAEWYPSYLNTYGKERGRPVLPDDQNVVLQIANLLKQVLPTHEKYFLKEIESRLDVWTSLNPNLSEVFLQAALLKVCKPFVAEKMRFDKELESLMKANREFQHATHMFEKNVFGPMCEKNEISSVQLQLGLVHQTLGRYSLLMQSYRKYLLDGSEEKDKCDRALSLLASTVSDINGSLNMASNEQLLRLHERFQYTFDVFHRARRLLREGTVLKQNRNNTQPRYLILFSDSFWICRLVNGTATDVFDVPRSYRIPTADITVVSSDHEDFETLLQVKSRIKSCTLIFSTANERRQWEKDINACRIENLNYKRRMSAVERVERKKSTSIFPQEVTQNTLTKPPMDEGATSGGSPSQPSTPAEETSNFADGFSVDNVVVEQPLEIPPPGKNSRKTRRADQQQAVWIADGDASMCMMETCGTVFGISRRRHHCRDCGFVICKSCTGKAPVGRLHFSSQLVCPDCFDKIENLYRECKLFPARIVEQTVSGVMVRVRKDSSAEAKLVDPLSLFRYPSKRGLKRADVLSRREPREGYTFGRVFLGSRKSEVRYAELCGVVLNFYKATYDPMYSEQHVINGDVLSEKESIDGGVSFELVHRNQILSSERSQRTVTFRVEKENSVRKWTEALRAAVAVTSSQ